MPAIVLLPGMDGTGPLLADFVSFLDASFEPIVISYPTDQVLDYAQLEEFVRLQLPTDRPFVLLGESFSGPIAISLASKNPEGLIGLVLCCSFVKNPYPFFGPFRSFCRWLPVSDKVGPFTCKILFGRFATTSLRTALQRQLSLVAKAVFRARLHAVLSVNYSSRLAKVSVPLLYLRASEDKLIFSSAMQHIQKLAPTMKIVVLPAPHLLLQVVPAAAADILLQFVHQLPGL